MTLKPTPVRIALLLILLVAMALRLVNIRFGLPAMFDPDEPMFVLKAFRLLDHRTLNPGWFGHPGTTTIYVLALVDVVVVALRYVSGSMTSLPGFAAAAYADPSIIFVPSRLAMVGISLMAIAMTYILGRRLFGFGPALAGTAFLALNALHIAWSQVIRTDIHASLFMLIALYFAVRAIQESCGRDLIYAGLAVGFAVATKWPGGCAVVGVLGAGALRFRRSATSAKMVDLVASAVAVPIGLFFASPFILIDWRTALTDVSGEVATGHLGHSGHGFLSNLIFYLSDQVAGTMGWVGLALVACGLLLMASQKTARVTVLPTALLFMALISAQPQIWSRWLTPALPLLCLAAGLSTMRLATFVATQFPTTPRRKWVSGLVTALVLVPSASGAFAEIRERSNDTRHLASAWARTRIAPGSVVIVEHPAIDLLASPWTVLFPVGADGCVDGRKILSAKIGVDDIQRARRGSAIVDLGHVPVARLSSCRADFAILTYYDLYLAERDSYPEQVSTYRQLLGTGKTVALFRPRAGVSGGPITRIVALTPSLDRRTAERPN